MSHADQEKCDLKKREAAKYRKYEIIGLLLVILILLLFNTVDLQTLEFISEFNLMYIFSPLGLIGIFISIKSLCKIFSIKKWPTCEGKIISSKFESKVAVPGPSEGGSVYAKHYRVFYFPKIVYEYSVAGHLYEGSQLQYHMGPPFMSQDSSKANLMASDYPSGKTVNVYYNPNNHGDAVLIRGISISTYFYSLALLGFSLLLFTSTWFVD